MPNFQPIRKTLTKADMKAVRDSRLLTVLADSTDWIRLHPVPRALAALGALAVLAAGIMLGATGLDPLTWADLTKDTAFALSQHVSVEVAGLLVVAALMAIVVACALYTGLLFHAALCLAQALDR